MEYEEFDDSMIVSTPATAPKAKAAPTSQSRRPISAARIEQMRRQNADAVAANQRRQNVLSTESATEAYNKFVGRRPDLAANLRNRLDQMENES